MSTNPENKRNLEEKDESCRLRHGLNVQCLAHIFQYLNSADLYIVGGMNEFYQQIINDLVIRKHKVNFDDIDERGISISQVFERFGKKIQKIFFRDVRIYYDSFSDYELSYTIQLIRSIRRHCSADQLKSVEIETVLNDKIVLPIQFRKVEKFKLHKIPEDEYVINFAANFSESLRYLHLECIHLDQKFNWNGLTNVSELYLNEVDNIVVENFIEFLRQRPNLKVFHHDKDTFEDRTKEMCDAMAKYCGNTIQDYSGEICCDEEAARINIYSFISELKNVKKMLLMTHEICGGDLINGMKRLAENDSIETLEIKYCRRFPFVSCILQENSDNERSDMMYFSHLKTIKLVGINRCEHARECDPYKIFSVYGSRILPNVENLTINYAAHDWTIIEFAPKLRRLELFVVELTSDAAIKVLSILKKILQDRNNGPQNNGDSIEIKFKEKELYNLFAAINGRNDSITLSLVESA